MQHLFYQGPSFKVLHNNFAKQSRLDENAPIIAGSQIVVNAPVNDVWKVVYNIARWPQFYPDFDNIRLPSGVEPDAKFSFTLNKFPIRAKFAIVEPDRELSWTGASLWNKAIDRMTLEPIPDNRTTLRIEESFSGVLAPLFMSKKQLAKQHEAWLLSIKKQAEKSA